MNTLLTAKLNASRVNPLKWRESIELRVFLKKSILKLKIFMNVTRVVPGRTSAESVEVASVFEFFSMRGKRKVDGMFPVWFALSSKLFDQQINTG